ncbi:ComEC/Rec2 family competence protein [Kribbella deserti]|uniref:ComEC/Rec2 family competence protein n=1 Tax=Kribbella deserti TaxID=1926257 RepID=A0ABV6QDH7_9ACTN
MSTVVRIAGDPSLRRTAGSRRPPYVVVRVIVEEVTGRGRTSRVRNPVLLIGSPQWIQVRFGQRVVASGRLAEVQPGDDMSAVLSTRAPPRPIAGPAWWLRAAEHVRAGLRESVAPEPEAVRGLVPALVMGDDAGLPPELVEDFKTTGLTHLSAVSGTNLTLLLAFVVPLARLLGVRARGLMVVGLATVVVFIILARPQPSVLRAAAMGVVALAAITSGGTRRGVRSLSAAVLALLLLDISLARSIGFALSVLATAGIVLVAPGWRDAMTAWMPRWLAEAVACPLAAQLACTPVVAWLSGEVSLVAVGANLLAGPAVGPATVVGFGAAGIALLSADLARLAGWIAAWPARWIILVATEGAELPGATSRWPVTFGGIALLVGLTVVLTIGLHRLLVRPVAMLVCVCLLVVVVLRPVRSLGWPPDDWVLVACDVGQGDGLVLNAGPGAAVVVDAGPDPPAIDRCLDDLGIRQVPLVVLSHFHADHAGGIAGIFEGREIGEIDISPYLSPPAEVARVHELAAEHEVPVRSVRYGERRTAGALAWTVVWPARVPALNSEGEGSPENNASIALLVEVAGLRILLTGDLEPESQRAVVASGADLRADVLKVAHHGSARQDPAFVAATGARLAVISAGVDNDYGHPAPRTLDLLRRQGMRVIRTDLGGSVAVVRRGDGLAVATERHADS